jgi:putative MATE family efflux protein
MAKKTSRLASGPVGRHLIDMTVPVLFGIATMMGQALIDAWFIGQVGVDSLAAYSFGFPILMIVTSVAIGLGAGTSSVVARALGNHDRRRARRLSTDAIILSFLITAIVAGFGIVTIDPLFRMLGASADLLPLIRSFMTILYLGVPFIVVGMVGMASMRATGDTRLPGKLMVIASVLNIILDPILIFGIGPIPALGLDGAALAALIARGAIFVGTVYFLRVRLRLLVLSWPRREVLLRSWRDILHVGLPAAGTNIIVPMGATIVTAMIATFGTEAVAGFGVASRIETMMLVLYYAMSSIIGPFVGQNLSAGKEDRILRSLWLCTVFCIASGLVIAAFLAALSGVLPGFFSEDPEAIRVTQVFLWVVPISYGAYGMVMVMNAAFNGLGKPMPGVWVSLMRILVLYVPLAMLAMQFFGVVGIFAAYALANILTGLFAYAWARGTVRQLFRDGEAATA